MAIGIDATQRVIEPKDIVSVLAATIEQQRESERCQNAMIVAQQDSNARYQKMMLALIMFFTLL